jgi:exonuclease III
MKSFFSFVSSFFVCLFLNAQSFENISFGTQDTFEVMTWNLENFPKNSTTTINYVTQIIEALDIDLIAIQEISNEASFLQLVSNLPDYYGYLESTSYDGLALLYKSDATRINNIYRIYDTAAYWNAFPRAPMVIDLTYNNQQIYIINNHFKCCGDGVLNLSNSNDEETRRYEAMNLLKTYIDTNLPNKNVIVVGDLNDVLTDVESNNVFQNVINDTTNYLFSDFNIAEGSSTNWSYPSWPSHLDHILITNELFDEFNLSSSNIEVIKLDESFSGGWNEYDQNVSDHRPVALKLTIDSNLGLQNMATNNLRFSSYPNPANTNIVFNLNPSKTNTQIQIVDIFGHLVYSKKLTNGTSKVVFNVESLSNGIYVAKLTSANNTATIKIIVSR